MIKYHDNLMSYEVDGYLNHLNYVILSNSFPRH